MEENINLKVDNQAAKEAVKEVTHDISDLEGKIRRLANNRANNNNTISNKQVATVQGGLSDLYQDQDQLQRMLSSAKGGDDKQVEGMLSAKLDALTQAIEKISKSDSYRTIINNQATRTTSSRAFNQPSEEQEKKLNAYKADYNKLRSDVNNLINSNRRTSNNFEVGKRSGYISYNRYQEYKQSASNNLERYGSYTGRISNYQEKLNKELLGARQKYNAAQTQAEQPNATRDDVNQARIADEYVKQLEKVSQKLNSLSTTLERSQDDIKKTNKTVNEDSDDYVVGARKGSLAGQSRYIARSAITGAMASSGSLISQGNSSRLSSFNDIKGIAYANGESHADNHVLDLLSNSGYQYGYTGSEMAGFAGAYSGSTGNTSNYNSVANSWARQARLTGSDESTTQSLEQSAGNASGLSGSQMSRLGNQITNEITSSGMTAKATQQQQGLTELYNNATQYGANYQNLRQIAGLQGSLASLGSQFQGTTGANNIIQATNTLGNYNSLQARVMFARGTGTRYSGIKGQARLMQDMQDMNKNPASMGRVLNNYQEMARGDNQVAAYRLSEMNPNVSMSTWEKLLKANQQGKLSQSTLNKYLNDDQKTKKNAKTYQRSGTSSIQRSNSALANSAQKASESLDGFRNVLAQVQKTAGGSFGGFGGVGMNIASAVGGSLLQGAGAGLAYGLVSRHGGIGNAARAVFSKGGLSSARQILRNGGSKAGSLLRGLRSGGVSTLKTAGSSILDKGANVLRSSKGLATATSSSSLLSKVGVANAAFGVLDVGSTLLTTKAGSRKRYAGVGRGIGATAGSAIGGTLGSALGPVGTIVGGVAGGWLGGKVGSAVGTGVHYLKDRLTSKKKKRLHGKDDWKVLRSYNKMLDKAKTIVDTAKSISLNGDSTAKADSTSNDDSSDSDIEKNIRKVAKKVGKDLSVDPSFVYAQLMHETGGSHLAGKNNYSGITYAGQQGASKGTAQSDGGTSSYANFDSLTSYEKALETILKKDGIGSNIKTVEQYASALKRAGYYTASESEYASGMKHYASKYANGGIRSFASGAGLISSQPTMVNGTDLFAESGTEAFIPLNTSHSSAGLSALNDLAGVFGKKLVSPGMESTSGKQTTINPSYNINLTIQGGTDNPNELAQTVATKVQEMLRQFEQQQNRQSQLNYYAN